MNFGRHTLKGILILASALTIAGCSGDNSSQVEDIAGDSMPRREVVNSEPKAQPKAQPKAKGSLKSKCLPISSRSCWIWNTFR